MAPTTRTPTASPVALFAGSFVTPASVGSSVVVGMSAAGDLAVGDNTYGGGSLVSVYTYGNVNWTLQQSMTGSNSAGAYVSVTSIAFCKDGTTLVVGMASADANRGAVWIYFKNGGVWTEQIRLTPSGVGGSSTAMGTSVACSDDGNTVSAGGILDSSQKGAVFVFVRTAGPTWVQQAKIVPTIAGNVRIGRSTALSADGNRMVIGSEGLDGLWVYTRSGGIWTLEQKMPTVTGATLPGAIGYAVSMSSAGDRIIAGDPYEDPNANAGGCWIFVRSGTTWTQESGRIRAVGIGATYNGWSVTMNNAGDKVMFGALLSGGVSVYSRSGTVWSHDRSKQTASSSSLGESITTNGNIFVAAQRNTAGDAAQWATFYSL